MSLTGVAIMLMMLGFLCLMVGFWIGSKQQPKSRAMDTVRSAKRKSSTKKAA